MMRLGYLKTGEMVKTLRFDGKRRVFSTRLRAAGQLLELKLLFSKKRRVVLISVAPFVFHLVARVARQGINAPLSACFFLPAKAWFGYADTNVLL